MEEKTEMIYFGPDSTKKDRALLFQKLSKVIDECPNVPKNGFNSFQNYHYVEENDVVKTIKPVLLKHGLVPLPPTLKNHYINANNGVAIVTMGIADTETGEVMYADMVAEGFDKGDKKFPKVYASITKYFYLKMVLMGTGDDVEKDTQTDFSTNPQGSKFQESSKETIMLRFNEKLNELMALGYDPNYLFQQSVNCVGHFDSNENLTESQLEALIGLFDDLKDRL